MDGHLLQDRNCPTNTDPRSYTVDPSARRASSCELAFAVSPDGLSPVSPALEATATGTARAPAACLELATSRERLLMWHHCKAFLSSWGGILVWVGGWDILTDSRAWPHSGWRCATLCLSGLGMTVLTDTLYTNGGLSASWFSPGFGQGAPKLTLIARTTLGLSGTIMLWAGIFNGINCYTWVDSAQEEEGGWLGQAGGWKYVTKDLVPSDPDLRPRALTLPRRGAAACPRGPCHTRA